MIATNINKKLVLGLNIPAEIGMAEKDICTPALLIDLNAFEKNIRRMRDFVKKKE